MPESVILLIVLFFVLTMGLGVSLSAFALGDPHGFVQMLPGARWITGKKVWEGKSGLTLAYLLGGAILILLLVICFAFGSFTVTFVFDLWTSPISRLLEPR